MITVSAAPAIAIGGFGDRDALVSVIAISELRTHPVVKRDALVRRTLTGHVMQEMQRHYSHVGTEESARRSPGLKPLADTKAVQNGQHSGDRRPCRRSFAETT